ncbi:MAG TPA: L-seryl-tRNA(Sec) selenium transferase [Candidatus Limnocylindrales bacterium]
MASPVNALRPPSVERLLAIVRPRLTAQAQASKGPAHRSNVAAAREILADERARIARGQPARDLEALAIELTGRLQAAHEPALGGVINATGVIVHTNLGRAPWPAAAIAAAAAAAGGYLFLELDHATGRRGARFRESERHLIALTGADDALVVNNNAAAVALAVGLAGRGRGVAVSRGELVEIGGGVRIPEIVRRAGAHLVEVGTTNRTRVADFEAPLADGRTRVVLRVHPSNFRQSGFTQRPDARELADLAHEHGAIVIDDLGSGALLDTKPYGLPHERMPAEALADGADLVTFSGDKLLGGPQAGCIVGRADLIARLRRDPLTRAMRPDKVTLAGLAATLGIYRAGRAVEEIPVWRMIAESVDSLRASAEAVRDELEDVNVPIRIVESEATVGGGSLPDEVLPSIAIAVGGPDAAPDLSPDRLVAALRTGEPAVIGRIAGDVVLLDLRTVDPEHRPALAGALRAAVDVARRGAGARDEARGSAVGGVRRP